ncbi:MAG: imidazole glycerol phosphate synthase cyclase subunit [Sulfuricella denitrificans]|nr:imidazole glycerol phosphate synthase cyclase subunit [Sulfuricella denitrificans]
MLKTRIVGVLIIKNGIVVQSLQFNRYLPVGRVAIAVEYLNRWGIDDIVLLDMDATPQGRSPNFEKIREYSRFCQVPLTVGGGVRSVKDMENLLHAGADRIALNASAIANPQLISEGARLFGKQCMVISIDVRRKTDGNYEVFSHSGTRPTGQSPEILARQLENLGAGEILLTSIDNDGMKQGFDLELVSRVAEAVDIPLVACGGAGHPGHLLEVCKLGVSGVAAGNFYHYTEHSVIVAKSYLHAAGINVRLDSFVTYDDCHFDSDGRVARISDETLEKLRFKAVPEEVI